MKIVFIPALIVVPIDREQDTEQESTRDEVESIRDGAITTHLLAKATEDTIRGHGYHDIDPENIWHERQVYKAG